jgi:DNA-binding beta-propeller fold protein YncE
VVDSAGFVYVLYGCNIQKFDSDGTVISKWVTRCGSGDGEFSGQRIAVDDTGFVYVADRYRNRIQKFTSDGVFISKWGNSGSGDGQFYSPKGITGDDTGFVYVVDTDNQRIQKFTSDGTFITKWGIHCEGDGHFCDPLGIAVDATGFAYVVDSDLQIQKFTSDGTFITKWGINTSIDDDGAWILKGIAVDGAGFVYVAEIWNSRIQKFTSDGTFINKWGTKGSEDGQLYYPYGIAVDNSGSVYVADSENNRIQKFGSDGTFISKWEYGGGYSDGDFYHPYGIAVDSDGSFYVADDHRIQKFGSDGTFITKFGGFGSEPGLLSDQNDIYISPDGSVYVADSGNNRIQVFRKADKKASMSKAIIVAGGGPGDWNNLWDATQICANYAYRALTYQGYTKDTIYYLSHDTDLDLDSNGILDDVDAAATNANFKTAVTEWAKDAGSLFIYMVDHGGEGIFRMGATEVLYATEFDAWLDELQGIIPGNLVLVYDACSSGSFLSSLTPPPGKQRIFVSSAASDQEAIFATQGKTSFSFMFWASIFNGDSFYESFRDARKNVGLTYRQTPQIDANGNGIADEEADQIIARSLSIGNETKSAGDLPFIGSVSPPRTLTGKTSALIYAENVIDADGISRVWAVITPPDYSPGPPGTPVTDLPILDLKPAGNNRYEAIYEGFDRLGDYNIAIFASDRKSVMGLPEQTTFTQSKGTASGGRLAADFGSNGLYLYDGTSWKGVAGWDAESMTAWGSRLVADFGNKGIYIYDGASWTGITGWNPENTVAWGDRLAADFGSSGLYVYDGAAWRNIAGWDADRIMTWGDRLAADFGIHGIWVSDGASWTGLTAWNPDDMQGGF